jgi:hypothetical protein
MPIVKFPDNDSLGKALALLLQRGAVIEARDNRQLVVTIPQQQALIEAGLLDGRDKANGSADGTKTTRKKKY